ncbi:DUF4124 domain-containing protein [Sedimenticola selenatireducens]|uniref:DUF4124 domain-containing protein n=1 Tax=Sedimenticola selenatireducens TaxID=191960 RepID=A0A557S7M6_9GAMM|nr:DUF4124 domain-containing protein [Sedimenticola selenatireducens]TVO73419.1 DUF4124 domain-containing protein [Sedimenticola selenatireducens]TVT63360.1 MAG: DUF4124 domain-containing protein [Sedimenticola selenatireducens]
MNIRIVALSFMVLYVAPAESAVYKCVLDGKTTYSQRPCEGKISEVEIKPPPTLSGSAKSTNDFKEANKELDAAINERRGQRKLRGLKQDLVILRKKRDGEMAKYRSEMRRALTKADVIIIQQHIANRRSEYAEAIKSKEDEIRSASKSIGPAGY